MNVIGVIPARWHSQRFEGKVLADILGKPVIQHVWERAKKARTLDDLIVATDKEEVIRVVKGFGGKAVYTSKDQPSGTDRITEVVNPIDVDVIVNIQGDEPLIHHTMIDDLARATELGARELRVILMELDLAGRIERHGQGLVSLRTKASL